MRVTRQLSFGINGKVNRWAFDGLSQAFYEGNKTLQVHSKRWCELYVCFAKRWHHFGIWGPFLVLVFGPLLDA